MKEIKEIRCMKNQECLISMVFPFKIAQIKRELESFNSQVIKSPLSPFIEMIPSLYSNMMNIMTNDKDIKIEEAKYADSVTEHITKAVKELNKIYTIDESFKINIHYGDIIIIAGAQKLKDIVFVYKDDSQETFEDIYSLVEMSYNPTLSSNALTKYYHVKDVYKNCNLKIEHRTVFDIIELSFRAIN